MLVARTALPSNYSTCMLSTCPVAPGCNCIHSKTVPWDFVRDCDSRLSISEGVSAWLRVHREGRLPVLASCLPYDPSVGGCKPSCTTTLPELLQGQYRAAQLSSTVNMQRHIRHYGSIM
jgi:hypothetical protein